MMISVKKKKDQGKKTTSIGKLQRRVSSKKTSVAAELPAFVFSHQNME